MPGQEGGKREVRARQFVRDERGATAIEYGLIACLVAVGFLGGLKALSSGNSSSWNNTSEKITDAMKQSGK
jgi:pilus assembly protein Flp/PilA